MAPASSSAGSSDAVLAMLLTQSQVGQLLNRSQELQRIPLESGVQMAFAERPPSLPAPGQGERYLELRGRLPQLQNAAR